ncbi:hypothetical protein ACLB2K_033961 [Fragaria x ananassa]
MMPQQACKLASSMATMTCKLASSMTTMHQQASNDHITKTLNPAAKPFLPLHRDYYSMPSSLPSDNIVPAPLLLPNFCQPYIPYCYLQPCLNQPQRQCYTANFYNPSSFVTPQLSGHVAPCFVPNTGCHSSTSKDPLRANILKQIEYYFSDENLQHDRYLISLMDDKGWVPVSIIANFNRVKAMSTSIPFILDSLVDSRILEVEDNKIRRQSAKEFALTESSEPVLEGQTEAGAHCTKTINAANSILTMPTTATPMNQQGQVEIMPPSPPSRHDTVKGKGQLESSSSPKYFMKAQLIRPLLDFEFVRAYLVKGDEVFDDDRFSEYRLQTQKKKRKELGEAKSPHITFSGSYLTRNKTSTMKFNLQFMYV